MRVGSKHSLETKAKMATAHTGITQSAETIDKRISTLRKPEIRAKLSSWTGRKHTVEERAKISIAHQGRSAPWNRNPTKIMSQRLKMLGELNSNSVLTQQKAAEIRAKYIPRVYSIYRLAYEYGISVSVVWNVIHLKRYKPESGS
jgi:hypothetical protein